MNLKFKEYFIMKSTAQLTKENNVKALRLNNTDREIFENYMTYVLTYELTLTIQN